MTGSSQQKDRGFHYRHLKGGLGKIYMGLKVFGLEHKQGDMYKHDKVNITNSLR
jgi:hypothetical protein